MTFLALLLVIQNVTSHKTQLQQKSLLRYTIKLCQAGSYAII